MRFKSNDELAFWGRAVVASLQSPAVQNPDAAIFRADAALLALRERSTEEVGANPELEMAERELGMACTCSAEVGHCAVCLVGPFAAARLELMRLRKRCAEVR